MILGGGRRRFGDLGEEVAADENGEPTRLRDPSPHRGQCLHQWAPDGDREQSCTACGIKCTRDRRGQIEQYYR
jgi:hypothetical protein